jgi:striatin 1/3/4
MLTASAGSRIANNRHQHTGNSHPSYNQHISLPMLGSLQGLQSQSLQNQNQQQQQQQQQQQGGQQSNNIPPPPPQNGQDFTLSSVLHFLQTEWRKYERDRNEWEIERAEMRVRRRHFVVFVAFLFTPPHCRLV